MTTSYKPRRLITAKAGDGQEMREAIEALNTAGIRFRRQTAYHLKIGAWNYYPGRGTLIRDGETQSTRHVEIADLLNLLNPPTI